MANFLVTGGAGFIGSHIVERLVKDGQSVRVLDDFSSGKRSNLEPFASKIEVLEGDLRRPSDCKQACADIDIVFHEGAVPSVPKSVADPVTSHQANVDGTFNILLAARDAKCKRLIFAASSSAYGDLPELPKRRDGVSVAFESVCGCQACRRVLSACVLSLLRTRDVVASLFQRVRSASGSQEPVCGCHSGVRVGGFEG